MKFTTKQWTAIGSIACVAALAWGAYIYLKPAASAPTNSISASDGSSVSLGTGAVGINNGTINNITNQASPLVGGALGRPADEKLPGFAAGFMVATNDVTEIRRKYHYAFHTAEGSSVAFFLSASNRFAFAVTDVNKETYTLDITLGSNGIPFGTFAYIICEVGIASSYSYMRALSNGREVARRDFDFPIDLGSRQWSAGTLNGDNGGGSGGAMMFMELGMFTTTLSDKEIKALSDNAISAYGLSTNK